MIYFIAIFGAIVALSFTDFTPKLRKIGAIISILLLAMLAGWRTMGGSDFFIYQDVYYGLSLNYMSAEFGYAIVNNLFSTLGFSFNAFLFAYSFISIAILVYFLQKHTKYPSFALLFYMGCYFFFYNMVLNRQMICMALSLWVIYWWNNNNKLLSILCLFIGVSFHQSIIVLLPFLCVFEALQHTSGKKFWIAFFAAFIGITVLFSPLQVVQILGGIPGLSFFANRTLGYLSAEGSEYTLNMVEYLKMGIAVLVVLPWIKTIFSDKKQRIWLFFYMVGAILLIWTRNVEILFRLFAYFDLSLLVLLPLCIDYFTARLSFSQKRLSVIAIYGVMGLLAIGAILYRTGNFGGGVFWQYQFYFM